jgi:hypothetical protein
MMLYPTRRVGSTFFRWTALAAPLLMVTVARWKGAVHRARRGPYQYCLNWPITLRLSGPGGGGFVRLKQSFLFATVMTFV